jgi:hypothetical protein
LLAKAAKGKRAFAGALSLLMQPSQMDVDMRYQGRRVGDADLKVGFAIAVYVARQDEAGKPEFAGCVMEVLRGNVVKGLIVGRVGIGIDRRQIDHVLIGMAEVLYDVVARALANGLEVGEKEGIGADTAREHVGTIAGIDLVVAAFAAYSIAGSESLWRSMVWVCAVMANTSTSGSSDVPR